MVKVKPLDQAREDYKDAASIAARRYADAADRVEWKEAAIEGQELYEEMMRSLEVLRRRLAGIRKVSDAEFRKAMKEKGAKVIRERMEAADGKWVEGFRPFADALRAVELPARTADPMENIDRRLKAIVKALVEKKKELMGS